MTTTGRTLTCNMPHACNTKHALEILRTEYTYITYIYVYSVRNIYIYICACNICVDIRDHWCAEDALATVVFRRPLWRPFRGCRRSGWGLRHRVPLGVGHSEELRTQMATWVAGWLAAGEDFTWGGFSDHLGPYCQPICLHYRIYRLPP